MYESCRTHKYIVCGQNAEIVAVNMVMLGCKALRLSGYYLYVQSALM